MNNIDWNEFYHRTTLKSRREYLRSIFKDRHKKVNKILFLVNPVKSQEADSTIWQRTKNSGRRTLNLFRSLARYALLPFPVTWTHKNTDRLVQKAVFSIEDYMMGDFKIRDYFSAFRSGAPQYRALLIGVLVGLVGFASAVSIFSLGAAPIVATCVAMVYFGYAGIRASRKSKLMVAYLKSRMGTEKEGNKVQQLFIKMYKLVTLLEKDRKFINEDSAKIKIEKSIKNELSKMHNEDINLTHDFSTVIKDVINPFLKKMNSTAEISGDELLRHLNTLIDDLENIDIYNKFEVIKTQEMIAEIMAVPQKNEQYNQIEEFKNIVAKGTSENWTTASYIAAINNSDLEGSAKNFFINKLGGQPIINFFCPTDDSKSEKMQVSLASNAMQEIEVSFERTSKVLNQPNKSISDLPEEMLEKSTYRILTLPEIDSDHTMVSALTQPEMTLNSEDHQIPVRMGQSVIVKNRPFEKGSTEQSRELRKARIKSNLVFRTS